VASRGGFRAGAGRPKARDTFLRNTLTASPIRAAEMKIVERLPWLVDKLLILAGGVTVQTVDKKGALVVYTEKPDIRACEYLINRVLGQPTQPIDLSDEIDRIAEEYGLEPEAVRSLAGELRRAG
jgi:hypothetical protein